MSVPFSREQFLAVFTDYNVAVWPAPLLLTVLAGVIVSGMLWRPRTSGRWVSAILALLALWTGVAYHWTFFTELTPAAWAFGAMFVLEAALLLWLGVRRGSLAFRPQLNARGVLGGAFILFALAIYPALGSWLGHHAPAAPTFGTPCSTTIFLLGVLLWADEGARRRDLAVLLVVPTAWALVGSSAALQLGMREDLALPAAALAGWTALIVSRRRTFAASDAPGFGVGAT
jgi:hypothetical protein